MLTDLERARESYGRGAWTDAYEAFRCADDADALAPDDLHRLGVSAYLIGQELEFEAYCDRLHRIHAGRQDREAAARSAFWLSLSLLLRGQVAQSTAWAARAQRLVEDLDCVECGYAEMVPAERQLRDGHADAAHAMATRGAAIGERFGDADLVAIARHVQARALIAQNQLARGLDLLDEMMLPVVAGDLSPIVTGLLYCSVIEACRDVYAMSRAREWTLAFSRWCERQSEALAFSGTCLADHADVLRFHGAWPDALAATFRACDCAARAHRKPPAAALYQRGEIHRVRGEHREAEAAYRAASDRGFDPQPGLGLLRLAQGQIEAASAAMRRALQSASDPSRRARLLAAAVEVAIAGGEIAEAHAACDELHDLSGVFDAGVLKAAASQATGAIHLAEDDAGRALAPLRRAFELWTQLEAPYDAARVREQIAIACRALGDKETETLEIAAARSVFEELGAREDLARIEARGSSETSNEHAALSSREREVIRLVAAGHTNKAIAARLALSERTVDRHVSNILTKLDVSSRTAATAYAYEHGLL